MSEQIVNLTEDEMWAQAPGLTVTRVGDIPDEHWKMAPGHVEPADVAMDILVAAKSAEDGHVGFTVAEIRVAAAASQHASARLRAWREGEKKPSKQDRINARLQTWDEGLSSARAA